MTGTLWRDCGVFGGMAAPPHVWGWGFVRGGSGGVGVAGGGIYGGRLDMVVAASEFAAKRC